MDNNHARILYHENVKRDRILANDILAAKIEEMEEEVQNLLLQTTHVNLKLNELKNFVRNQEVTGMERDEWLYKNTFEVGETVYCYTEPMLQGDQVQAIITKVNKVYVNLKYEDDAGNSTSIRRKKYNVFKHKRREN